MDREALCLAVIETLDGAAGTIARLRCEVRGGGFARAAEIARLHCGTDALFHAAGDPTTAVAALRRHGGPRGGASGGRGPGHRSDKAERLALGFALFRLAVQSNGAHC